MLNWPRLGWIRSARCCVANDRLRSDVLDLVKIFKKCSPKPGKSICGRGPADPFHSATSVMVLSTTFYSFDAMQAHDPRTSLVLRFFPVFLLLFHSLPFSLVCGFLTERRFGHPPQHTPSQLDHRLLPLKTIGSAYGIVNSSPCLASGLS
jgi:hypothetical protein